MAFQFPPKQVVRTFNWAELVAAREQYTEFPVVYAFGGPAPAYLDIGAVSRAWTGRHSIDPSRQTGDQMLAFIEINPYGWVP